MVLVSDGPNNYVSLLQTKLSDREGHEAGRIGLETMPLDEHIEGRHGEGQARLKIGPAPVHDLFEMADERQHREDRLDEHTVLPFAALTQLQVGGIALRRMEGGIAQDNHLVFALSNQPLEGVIRDIGRGTRPSHDQPPLIEQETLFPPDDPAMIGEAFPADLLGAAAFAHGMDQLDPIGVDDAEDRRGGQEGLRPVVMGREETKEPRPLGHAGEQGPIVARQPPIERPVAPTFERV